MSSTFTTISEGSAIYTIKEKGLGLKDIEICGSKVTIDSSKICKSVPKPHKNAVFVVDTELVKERDFTCNDFRTPTPPPPLWWKFL